MVTSMEFLGLESIGEGRWRLPVTERITSGSRGALFGGVGLAAGVAAMEQTTGLPAVWATCQFVGAAPVGSDIDLAIATPAVGRTITQAQVSGAVDGRGHLTIVGAAGRRPPSGPAALPTMPDAGDPADAVPVERDPEDVDAVHNHVDTRMARGMYGFTDNGTPSGDETTLQWLRMTDVAMDHVVLAVLGDYMSSAVGNAMGEVTYGSSLDNSIRYAWPVDDETAADGWILCESRIEFIGDGFAHGTGLMWSRSGRLLATVSQTMTAFAPS